MTTDTIKQLGAEFHHAADSLADTLARLDNARRERLTFLRRCSKDSTARLATLKEEVRTLPEQIAKWDAEAARLESQTAEDLLRQALEPVHEKPKPEPYRAGLPPERLRKVWAEWDVTPTDDVVTFRDGEYNFASWGNGEGPLWWPLADTKDWSKYSLRPHGATWARVEAMADEAEKPKCPACGKQPDRATRPLSVGEHVTCQSCGLYLRVVDGAWQIVRPVENCGHVAADGTCGHPNALTPECHDGVVCSVKAEKQAEPTLLDLTKLPPGTVCEATGEILTYLGRRIKPGEIFRIVEPDDGMGDKHPTNIEIEFAGFSIPALVPARVVKEGGEQ